MPKSSSFQADGVQRLSELSTQADQIEVHIKSVRGYLVTQMALYEVKILCEANSLNSLMRSGSRRKDMIWSFVGPLMHDM